MGERGFGEVTVERVIVGRLFVEGFAFFFGVGEAALLETNEDTRFASFEVSGFQAKGGGDGFFGALPIGGIFGFTGAPGEAESEVAGGIGIIGREFDFGFGAGYELRDERRLGSGREGGGKKEEGEEGKGERQG